MEIFDCTKKDVSVQSLQLPEPFVSFGWDPKSMNFLFYLPKNNLADKFCVLVGSGNKVTPLVYKLDSGRPVPSLISKLEAGTQLNTVQFAPIGGWLAVYGANSTAGHVFFIDTNGPEATRTRIVEHTSMNYVIFRILCKMQISFFLFF